MRRKTADLDAAELTARNLPSGWTAAELVSHLANTERRWFVWGFLGEPIGSPWGDQDADGRWITATPIAELLDLVDHGGARTREIQHRRRLTLSRPATRRAYARG